MVTKWSQTGWNGGGSLGRLVLDRWARAWLHVADPAAFDVVVMPVESGGVLLVPTEGFGRRWLEVTS